MGTIDLSKFSGAYALFENGKCIDSGSSGYANKMLEIANSPEFSYGSASTTKGFTSTAVLILISQGKIQLTDPASKYLGDQSFLSDEITIYSLLTHTSGVPDYFDESIMSDFSELWQKNPNYTYTKPTDFFDLISKATKENNLTKEFKYSNSGFVILAAIIEEVSGINFIDFIQKNIFDNAGMTHTGFYRFDETPPNNTKLACGYCSDGRTNIYSVPVVGGGDGGCFVSILDMDKFWKWFEDGAKDKNGIAQISKELIEKAWSIQATEMYGEQTGDSYGLGFWIQKESHDTIMLQGFDPGVCFLSFYNRKTKRTFTFAKNDENSNDDVMNKEFHLNKFC